MSLRQPAAAFLIASLAWGCSDPAEPRVIEEGIPAVLAVTGLEPGARPQVGSVAGGTRQLTVTGDFKAACRMGPPPEATYMVQGGRTTLQLRERATQPCIEGDWPLRYHIVIAPLDAGSHDVTVVHVNDRFRTRAKETVLDARGVFVRPD